MKIAGKTFESGGSIIHRDNKYMVDFVKYLGKFNYVGFLLWGIPYIATPARNG